MNISGPRLIPIRLLVQIFKNWVFILTAYRELWSFEAVRQTSRQSTTFAGKSHCKTLLITAAIQRNLLSRIDLLVALLTNTEPRLSFQQQERVLLAPAINQSLGRIQMPDSPLFGTEPFACILAGSAFCNDAIILLQSMQDLTSGKWRGDSPPTINTTEPIPADPSNSLSRMICAASSIYFRAFKDPPVAFASRSHSNALATIAACLEDTRNDATWTEYPGILLWVVLTALAAAVHHPQCSFFAMFVFRVGTSAAWWGPREARAAICTFLQVKKRSEDVGR